MTSNRILRWALVLGALLIAAFVAHKIRWEEVDVVDEAHGKAATDPYYSLRHVLQGAGATLEARTSLEPLPPADATLLLASDLWNIFPERDARLRAWVEAGGHLVLVSPHAHGADEGLHWVPLSSVDTRRRAAAKAPAPPDADDEDEDKDAPSGGKPQRAEDPQQRKLTPQQAEQQRRRAERMARMFGVKMPRRDCAIFKETDATTQPAFEPGRAYRGCTSAGMLRPLDHAVPTWTLSASSGTLAMRVPLGHGDVTGITPSVPIANLELLEGDNALIMAAVLQARPGRVVWIVEEESREPLLGWLWHEARTPFLLALAAVALSLWRLMARFGPREAVPPQARRSMGEQLRGTGQFIAGTDAGALHAATRKAFEDAARPRVEAWAERDDADRIAALARSLAPSHSVDAAALLAALHIGSGATRAQILAATAVLEQARRAILRAAAARTTS
ncbi:MAG: DUF4350 domain-containing protein [Burkholderiaceae bacterium]